MDDNLKAICESMGIPARLFSGKPDPNSMSTLFSTREQELLKWRQKWFGENVIKPLLIKAIAGATDGQEGLREPSIKEDTEHNRPDQGGNAEAPEALP